MAAWDRYDELFVRALDRFQVIALEAAVFDLRPSYAANRRVPRYVLEIDVSEDDLRAVKHVRESRENADPVLRRVARHGARRPSANA